MNLVYLIGLMVLIYNLKMKMNMLNFVKILLVSSITKLINFLVGLPLMVYYYIINPIQKWLIKLFKIQILSSDMSKLIHTRKVGPWNYIELPLHEALLTNDLVMKFIRSFIESLLSWGQYNVLVKLRYSNGTTRTVAPLFILNSLINGELFIHFILNHLTKLANWYNIQPLESIVIMFKITKGKGRLGSIVNDKQSNQDITTSSNAIDILIDSVFPRTLDITKWGTLVSETIDPSQLLHIDGLNKDITNLDTNIENLKNTDLNLKQEEVLKSLQSERILKVRELADIKDNMKSTIIIRTIDNKFEYHINKSKIQWTVEVFNYIFNKDFNTVRLTPFITFTIDIQCQTHSDHFKRVDL